MGIGGGKGKIKLIKISVKGKVILVVNSPSGQYCMWSPSSGSLWNWPRRKVVQTSTDNRTLADLIAGVSFSLSWWKTFFLELCSRMWFWCVSDSPRRTSFAGVALCAGCGSWTGRACRRVQLGYIWCGSIFSASRRTDNGGDWCSPVWHLATAFVPTRSQGVKCCRSDLVALKILFV